MSDAVYKPREVAAQLGVHVNTLADWRRDGRGPDYIRIGRVIRYPAAAVDRWLSAEAPASGRPAEVPPRAEPSVRPAPEAVETDALPAAFRRRQRDVMG